MNTPYPQYQRVQKPPAPRGLRRPASAPYTILGVKITPWVAFSVSMALIALALLPLIALGGTYTFYMLTGRVLPGVTAGTFAAGDLTRAELAQKLEAEWSSAQPLMLTDGSHTIPASALDLGLKIDAAATAARAHQIGRGGQALQEMLWLFRFGGLQVEPVITFDPQAARSGLERLSAQVNQPAQNATLRLENGEWAAVPGQNGLGMDIDATYQRLAAQPHEVLAAGILPMVTRPVAPRVSDLTPVLDQLRGMLEHPLPIQAYDPITDQTIDIPVPREVLAGWVTAETQEGGAVIGLDSAQVAAYLQAWQANLGPGLSFDEFSLPGDLTSRWQNEEPVSLTVHHGPTQYTVEAGDTLTRIAFNVGMPYWKIQQANPEIDPDRLLSGQVLTIPSKNEMLPLPVIANKRIVISISQQHLWTYENGSQRSEHVISTGIDRSPTIPGIYQIRTHELEAYASVWDLYMPHFLGIYEGWPGFMNGIHGLPTLSSGNRLWAGNLGRPVSYGCIILDLPAAEDLYNWAEEGVVVEIQP
jgi:lipoprotein-anchoring transpeptidase ErfK/SrfK